MLAPLYLIRASHIIPLIKSMDALTISTRSILDKVGLSDDLLSNPNRLILESKLWKLLALASEQQSCQHLASLLTESTQLHEYGEFPTQLLSSANLAQAIQVLIAHASHHNNNRQFWLEKEADKVWLCHLHSPCFKQGAWQVEQHVLNLMCRLVEFFSGKAWKPCAVKVQVRHAIGIEYSHYLGDADIEPSKPYSAIAIDSSLLNGQKTIAHFSSHLEALPDNFVEGFKLLLRDNYFGKNWLAEKIAVALDMSERTLKRKLRAQGTSLREVFDEVRFQQAEQLIIDGVHDYEALSQQLSYTHPNNFVRAFKRWSGVTPREYIRLRNTSLIQSRRSDLL